MRVEIRTTSDPLLNLDRVSFCEIETQQETTTISIRRWESYPDGNNHSDRMVEEKIVVGNKNLSYIRRMDTKS